MSTDDDDLDPRHIYVTQDGQFEYRRVFYPALVIRFHAPLDSILRDLDADYVRSAWAPASSVLEAHDVDPRGLSWGCGQPGEARGIGHGHPPRPLLETIGWIGTAETLGDFSMDNAETLSLLPRWASIAEAIEAADPPLCLMYDHYEAQRITRCGGEPIANDDVESALELIRVDSCDSPVEWVLFDPTKRHSGRDAPSDDPSAPWMRLGQAMYERDHVAVLAAMDAVRSEYSDHGARICLESAMAWLMIRSNSND
jgi:hypothetical protein